MRRIEIEITAAGEVRIDAIGFVGKSCEDATRALEIALGIRANSSKKPEYHRPEMNRVTIGGR